jgi:hypothetical protein
LDPEVKRFGLYLFLSINQIKSLAKPKLKLVSLTCLLIASKFLDDHPLSNRYIRLINHEISSNDLIAAEKIILRELDWKVFYLWLKCYKLS